MPESVTNAPELSVTELSGALKRTLEDRFSFVRVRGEVSGYRGPHASGHVYFCLKDAGARLDAVIWKQAFQRMKIKPTEGLEMIASGRITSFPGKSAYQIIVDSLEPAGVGALMALLEERRKALAAEGLFAAERKRPIPFLPETVGVVTSPTGAVIRDILHRLSDRFPRRVLVWPVRVQGETSAAEVAAAIRGFSGLDIGGSPPRPSVVIVARGGGSLEDLWGFNDEDVVRAAAASTVPIVSAIGHETDWTLLDHVADLRAPTPTGAAELCVPVRLDLIAQTADLGRRCAAAGRRFTATKASDLRSLSRGLPKGAALVLPIRQGLDRAGDQLVGRVRAALRDRQIRLGRAAALLARHSPIAELALRRERLAGASGRHARLRLRFAARGAEARTTLQALDGRAAGGARRLRERLAARCDSANKMLATLSYRSVLARGYALIRDDAGGMIRLAAAVEKGAGLTISFSDGDMKAIAEGPPGQRRKSAKTSRDRSDQGALF